MASIGEGDRGPAVAALLKVGFVLTAEHGQRVWLAWPAWADVLGEFILWKDPTAANYQRAASTAVFYLSEMARRGRLAQEALDALADAAAERS